MSNHSINYSVLANKLLQKVDFEEEIPPFWGFSTKTLLVYHGFRLSRFFLSPKKRDEQGPPVNSLDRYATFASLPNRPK